MNQTDARALLLEKEARIIHRLELLRADRRREHAPLSADFEEQAVERENDPVLDGLDDAGRSELAAIRTALARLESGTYEQCASCGDTIPAARLAALPETSTCTKCAELRP